MKNNMKEKLKEHRPIIIIFIAMLVVLAIMILKSMGVSNDDIVIFFLGVGFLLFLGGVIYMALERIFYDCETMTGFVMLVGAVVTWIICYFLSFVIIGTTEKMIGPFNGPYGEAGGFSLNTIVALIPALIIAAVIYFVGTPLEKNYRKVYNKKARELGKMEADNFYRKKYHHKLICIKKLAITFSLVGIVISIIICCLGFK